MAAKPTICAALIVKNESAVIERCLTSARELIDTWVIVDTGSTDDTTDRIAAALEGIDGVVEHRPWRDFGTNRTELVKLAHGRADWVLLLDADMVVETDGDRWRDELANKAVDAWLIDVVGGTVDYAMPYLVRGSVPWHYEGVTHEYLTADGDIVRRRLPGLRVRHFADGGSRQDKFVRDRRLLEGRLKEAPGDERATFYLAQTYADLGMLDEAITTYRRRAEMGGWAEESFVARLRAGALAVDRDGPAASADLLAAWAARPTRAEPLYQLARGCRQLEQWVPAYTFAQHGLGLPVPDDILFVEGWVWDWGLRFERSVAAWYVGQREQGRQDTLALLARDDLPPGVRETATANLRFYR